MILLIVDREHVMNYVVRDCRFISQAKEHVEEPKQSPFAVNFVFRDLPLISDHNAQQCVSSAKEVHPSIFIHR